MFQGKDRSNRRKLLSTVVIFILMYTNRLFTGSFEKISLNMVILLTYSGVLLFPKTWWTKKRIILAACVIMMEVAFVLIRLHEINQIYFLAILILAASVQMSLSKSPIPMLAILLVTSILFIRFGHDDPFSLLSFLVVSIVFYFYIRSRMQRNEIYEQNERHLVELQEAYDQLQEASTTAMQYAVLEERTRIARDIHDAVGHSLTSLIVQMQALRYMVKKEPLQAEKSLEEMLVVARHGLQDIRTSVHSLAEDRSKSGITPLKALLSRMEATAGIQYSFYSDIPEEALNVEINRILFRVLQEAITNIIRHSKATYVEVRLKKDQDIISFMIRDNGIMEPSQQIIEGFGLKVMKERIRELDGNIHYSILDPNGFEIKVEMRVKEG